MPTRKRKELPVVGTVTEQRKELETKCIANEVEFDWEAREEWRDHKSRGAGSLLQNKQQLDLDVPNLNTLNVERIEYNLEYEYMNLMMMAL